MSKSEEWKKPVSWTSPDFALDAYDLVFLPGGHEKSVRQIIDSPVVHKHLADFFPKTKKPSGKTVAAVCHGVMVLSKSKGDDGKSVLYDCVTTALPARFEQAAFWGTRAFLGDYYKTYGAGSEDVEASVSQCLSLEWLCTDHHRSEKCSRTLRSTKTAWCRRRSSSRTRSTTISVLDFLATWISWRRRL
jgi:hypothetical protein